MYSDTALGMNTLSVGANAIDHWRVAACQRKGALQLVLAWPPPHRMMRPLASSSAIDDQATMMAPGDATLPLFISGSASRLGQADAKVLALTLTQESSSMACSSALTLAQTLPAGSTADADSAALRLPAASNARNRQASVVPAVRPPTAAVSEAPLLIHDAPPVTLYS